MTAAHRTIAKGLHESAARRESPQTNANASTRQELLSPDRLRATLHSMGGGLGVDVGRSSSSNGNRSSALDRGMYRNAMHDVQKFWGPLLGAEIPGWAQPGVSDLRRAQLKTKSNIVIEIFTFNH